MKTIPLTKGKFAIVDDEDYQYLSQWKWYCSNTGYAVRTDYRGRKKTISLHRVVTDCPRNKLVDHKNGNRLDNRKSNLRIVTKLQNNLNTDKRLGVSAVLYKGKTKFRARIKYRGVTRHLGYFKSKQEAVETYRAAKLKYYKEDWLVIL